MKAKDIKKIAVLGTGMMGPDITLLCAMANCPVVMIGRTIDSVQKGLNSIKSNLDELVGEGVLIREEARKVISLIQTATDL